MVWDVRGHLLSPNGAASQNADEMSQPGPAFGIVAGRRPACDHLRGLVEACRGERDPVGEQPRSSALGGTCLAQFDQEQQLAKMQCGSKSRRYAAEAVLP